MFAAVPSDVKAFINEELDPTKRFVVKFVVMVGPDHASLEEAHVPFCLFEGDDPAEAVGKLATQVARTLSAFVEDRDGEG